MTYPNHVLMQQGLAYRSLLLGLSDPKTLIKSRRRKAQRSDSFRKHLFKHGRVRIWISSFFRNISPATIANNIQSTYNLGVESIGYISPSNDLPTIASNDCEFPTLLILSNNDFSQDPTLFDHYISICSNSSASIPLFCVVWDYDNHHMTHYSFIFAQYSDMYVCAHNHSTYLLSCLGGGTPAAVIPSPVNQFKYSDIQELINKRSLPFHGRSDFPLGLHHYYEEFKLRNYLLESLSRRFDNVGIRDGGWYNIDNCIDNLNQWLGHTCSVAIPVAGDVPIRIFDSLITGSIPIVPDLISHPIKALGVPSNYFVSFSIGEAGNLDRAVQAANQLYYHGGQSEQCQRVLFALRSFHIDPSLSRLIRIALGRIIASGG